MDLKLRIAKLVFSTLFSLLAFIFYSSLATLQHLQFYHFYKNLIYSNYFVPTFLLILFEYVKLFALHNFNYLQYLFTIT